MTIFFEQEYLFELYRDGKTRDKRHHYQPSIVKKYQKTIRFLTDLHDVSSLCRIKGLHYEHLSGNLDGLSSIRLNDQYRILFRETCENGELFATICTITELSNHYQ
jgi:proteic killer suppression protein